MDTWFTKSEANTSTLSGVRLWTTRRRKGKYKINLSLTICLLIYLHKLQTSERKHSGFRWLWFITNSISALSSYMTRGINVVRSTPRCCKGAERRRRMSWGEDAKGREKGAPARCGNRRKGTVVLGIPRSVLLPRQSLCNIGAWRSTFHPFPQYYFAQPRLMPVLHSAIVLPTAGIQPVFHVFFDGDHTVSYYSGRGNNQRIPFHIQMLQLFQAANWIRQCSYLIVTDI